MHAAQRLWDTCYAEADAKKLVNRELIALLPNGNETN